MPKGEEKVSHGRTTWYEDWSQREGEKFWATELVISQSGSTRILWARYVGYGKLSIWYTDMPVFEKCSHVILLMLHTGHTLCHRGGEWGNAARTHTARRFLGNHIMGQNQTYVPMYLFWPTYVYMYTISVILPKVPCLEKGGKGRAGESTHRFSPMHRRSGPHRARTSD